jgi:hypothetical protein
VDLLAKALNLPLITSHVSPTTAQGTSWCLNKTKSTHINICKRWDGDGMGGGGGTVRLQVVAACHDCFPGDYTDDQVVGMACDYSSYLCGLWNLIHNEIYTLATRPFVQWQLGNIEPFLDMLPPMTQLIATVPRKINIVKCFLFQLERVRHYSIVAPDVLQHMGANCTMLREDHIENHHAVLTHWVNKHVQNVKHSHYLHASGLVWPAGDVKRTMKKLLSAKKEAEQEEDVILKRTDLPAYADSNALLDDWLLKPFLEILSEKKSGVARNPRFSDDKWMREAVVERQTLGQKRLEKTCLPLMVAYLKKVNAVGAAGGGGGGAAAAPVVEDLSGELPRVHESDALW